MSLSISILASGSSGNCSALRFGRGMILIDCGIGPRTAARRMLGLHVGVEDISAICLTHLDSDHFNENWIETIIRREIRVFCHESHEPDLRQRVRDPEFHRCVRTFNGKSFKPLHGVQAQAIHMPHDAAGSHAFRFHCDGGSVGYASDLGHVRRELIEFFADVQVLAIESNYDPQMQRNSGRPAFLQRRITGGHGHLSNQQALEAVRKILDQRNTNRRDLPRHIVLLHRSRQCNCPQLVRGLFSTDARIANRLTLAEQDQPTTWLRAAGEENFLGRQLELQWG